MHAQVFRDRCRKEVFFKTYNIMVISRRPLFRSSVDCIQFIQLYACKLDSVTLKVKDVSEKISFWETSSNIINKFS